MRRRNLFNPNFPSSIKPAHKSLQILRRATFTAERLESRMLLSNAPILVENTNIDGAGSLQAAVTEANGETGATTIEFDPTVFTPGSSSTIDTDVSLDLLNTTGLMTIQGPTNSAEVTVDGTDPNAMTQVTPFIIGSLTPSTGSVTADISGLTINGGVANQVPPQQTQDDGGDILNLGTLALSDCNISNGSGYFGGGIYNAGTLTIADSALSGNIATAEGGAIANLGVLSSINNSEFSSNTGFYGGAIFDGSSSPPTSAAIISDCSFLNNSAIAAGGGGGGVGGAIEAADGAVESITGCTFAGNNSGSGYGGAINLQVGSLYLVNSTISGNSAATGAGIDNVYGTLTVVNSTIAGNFGGGIYSRTATGDGDTLLDNTIVANNIVSKTNSDALDITTTNAPLDSTSSHNLIGSGGSGGLTNGDQGNIVLTADQSPYLTPLGSYGGPTQTIALQPLSPAIAAGSYALALDATGAQLTTDQRGFPLVSNNGSVDIGAFQTQANPLVVNTTSDDPVGPGLLSLRDAINLVDAIGGDQTITFDPTLTAGGSVAIYLTDGSLTLADPSGTLTIQGPGAGDLAVNGEDNGTCFIVENSSSAEISGLSITDGKALGGTGILFTTGGDIDNGGTLTLDGCNITEGFADFGGAIFNGGNLTINNCTIGFNGSAIYGGAIDNAGIISDITNTLFTSDSAAYGGAIADNSDSATQGAVTSITDCTFLNDSVVGGFGGAIEVGGTAVDDITGCTFTGNSTDPTSVGGAIYLDGGTLYLVNSTVSGNSSFGNGGGGVNNNNGTLTIVNCTIADNQNGGLVTNTTTGGDTILNNTIVADNATSATDDTPLDISGSGVDSSSSNNLIGSDTSGGLTNGVDGNIVGEDPDLAALNNYGGPTLTMALLPGSPAIAAGSYALALDAIGAPLTTDQRGFPMVPNGNAIDIGAFQTQPNPLVVNTLSDDPIGLGQLSLRDAINLANAMGGDQTITFAPSLTAFDPTIELNDGDMILDDTTGTLTIQGPGADVLSIDAQGNSTVFTVAPSSSALIEGLTITNGNAEDGNGGDIYNEGTLALTNCTVTNGTAPSGNGGDIDNQGALTLDSCAITDGTATMGSGGGIASGLGPEEGSAATLTVTNCTFSGDNAATGGGGGIENYGKTLTVTNSVFDGDSAGAGGGIDNTNGPGNGTMSVTDCTFSNDTAGNGGGIDQPLDQVSALVIGCTFTQDSAGSGGGGIFLNNDSGIGPLGLTVINSTFFDNTATIGGGIDTGNLGIGSTVSITNCTIADNVGGGVAIDGTQFVVSLYNTIVAGNISLPASNPASGPDDISGLVDTGVSRGSTKPTPSSNNLIGDGSGGFPIDPTTHMPENGNILGTSTALIDPDLGPLADNGGPTETMVPLAGSPAIGAGSIDFIPAGVTTDQRGLPRTVDGKVDIGAVEVQAAPTVSIVVTAPSAQTATAGVSQSFNLGSFTESGATGPYSVSVDWGDSTADTTFSLTSAGTITAQNHTYASAGPDTVSVTITDADDNMSNTGTFGVMVAPAATASIVVTPPSAQGTTAGVSTSFALGSFTESGATAPFSVSVNWGDGTADTVFSMANAGSIFNQSHTYASAGPDTVSVTITDADDNMSNTATFGVTVAPAAVTSIVVTPPSAQTATAGVSQSFNLGSFTESNATAPYSVDVDWGDGSADTVFSMTSPGTITAQNHTYASAGPDTVSITITDADDNMSNTGTFGVTVAPAAVTLIVVTPPSAQTATAGVSTSFALGSFTESGATAPFSVSVDWGDGTADTTFSLTSAGTITAQNHTYASAGPDTVSVTITDADENMSNTATFGVSVAPAAVTSIVVTPPASQTATAGVSTSFALGSFTESGATALFSVSVNWGDGTANTVFSMATAGTITAQNHTYASAGPDTVSVTITDADDNMSNTASFGVTVAAATPSTATQLVFIQPPTDTTAGDVITPAVTVAVEDQNGDIVTGDDSYVTLRLISDAHGHPRLSGTLRVHVQNGIATFSDLSLTKAGTYSFKATDGKLTSATSSSFQITPAAAVRMLIIQSPTLTGPGKNFDVEVELLDQFGNVATNDTSIVTLSLGHSRNAVLSGTLTAQVVNGIATFNDLSINHRGFDLLVATDSNDLPEARVPLFVEPRINRRHHEFHSRRHEQKPTYCDSERDCGLDRSQKDCDGGDRDQRQGHKK